MQYRTLGDTGLSVSAIGLGCSHLGSGWRGRTRSDMLRLLKHAVDRGITFFDTSDVYMQGESEALLGSALGPVRHDVVIATKAGFRRPINESALARIRPFLWSSVHRVPALARALMKTRRLLMRQDFSAQHLRKAVEGSLRRLATDRIDLLQLHSPPASAIDRDGALDTLERLRSEGKIRFYGLSYSGAEEAQFGPVHSKVATVQLPIPAGAASAIGALLDSAQRRRIGVIANQPLLKGALLQNDSALRSARVRLAHGLSLPQIALRYIADIPAVSAVLTGTTSIEHLDENISALEAPPLGSEALAWLAGHESWAPAQGAKSFR